MMPPKGPQCACAELAPQFGGAGVHQRAPQIERALVALLRDVDETADASEGGRRFGDGCRPLLAAMNRFEGFRKVGRNIGPCALLAEGIAFSKKLFESRDDGRPRNTELRCEFACRRQLRRGTKRSRQDARSYLLVDLAEHRRVGGTVHFKRIKLCPALSAFHECLSSTSAVRSRSSGMLH